ncbi:MAG: SIR2 family protein [Micrococcaceae bacterium]
MRAEQGDRHVANEKAIEIALALPHYEPVHKASVVAQAGLSEVDSESTLLAPFLSRALYRKHGWSQGRLLRNIAELATFTAGFGQDVSLITTNYDDYIDRELIAFINEYYQDPNDTIPGVTLDVLGESPPRRVIRAASEGAGTIVVHHIHGRVDSDTSQPSGEIVFSESSYSSARERTVDFLARQFSATSAFLSVGASLNDAPLIEALFQSERRRGRDGESSVKVAVLTPGPGGREEQEAHLTFSALRGEHLGMEILTAESYSQIAQFVEELRVCKVLQERQLLNRFVSTASYPFALQSWWEKWSASSWSTDHDEHHREVRNYLDYLSSELAAQGTNASKDEVLRLEVWIRRDPSVARDSRHLTQYANSTGPLYEIPALRRERIESPSNVASVRAFTSGKPLLQGLSELDYPDQASRWKSFLSVPISWDMDLEYEDFRVLRTVPVGVVTLASTLPLTSDENQEIACFAQPALSVQDYQRYLTEMEDLGTLIVDTRTP